MCLGVHPVSRITPERVEDFDHIAKYSIPQSDELIRFRRSRGMVKLLQSHIFTQVIAMGEGIHSDAWASKYRLV